MTFLPPPTHKIAPQPTPPHQTRIPPTPNHRPPTLNPPSANEGTRSTRMGVTTVVVSNVTAGDRAAYGMAGGPPNELHLFFPDNLRPNVRKGGGGGVESLWGKGGKASPRVI
jgi:hypothetical protein